MEQSNKLEKLLTGMLYKTRKLIYYAKPPEGPA